MCQATHFTFMPYLLGDFEVSSVIECTLYCNSFTCLHGELKEVPASALLPFIWNRHQNNKANSHVFLPYAS